RGDRPPDLHRPDLHGDARPSSHPDLAAAQGAGLRAGGRVAAGGPGAGAELRLAMPDMMQLAVDLTRRALVLTLELSLPVLLWGLVVGFLISLLQAVTQIQEQTLSFIPKILAVAATVFITLPWVLGVLVEYTREVVQGMRTVLLP